MVDEKDKNKDVTMVTLMIDGIPVKIEQGKTVIQAAHAVNIEIPTLCYHQALSPYGACRLCVVEIHKNGWKKIQASCVYKVEDGIEVKTNTPELQNIRRTMIELIMARAPDAERVREMAHKLGVEETRFVPRNEDCILCGLCVRMCCERMGQSVLGFKMRGDRRQVSPPFDVESPRCMVCGACFSVCPTASERLKKVSSKSARPLLDEFDQGLRQRSVIHIPFPQAVPNAAIVDKEHCVHFLSDTCKICQDLCEAKAIDFDQKEEMQEVHVGSVILSTGFDEYDAKKKSEYGYGRFANVVTSIEFERILSASGPFQGHIQRPGDRKEPKRIAFIQCVGSRDLQSGASYCSSVCCTYAIKEAIIAKEHAHDGLETTIFFMDIRTFGKDFEVYYERAKNEYGVRFIRAGVSRIVEDANTKNLKVHYEGEDGEIKAEEFDMIILSVGLMSKDGTAQLAKRLRVNLNEYGFCRTSEFMPVDTIRDGIYVCGASAGPKDIPETVTQASAAASKAMGVLAEARNRFVTKKEYPPEIDVSHQEPRIGVFICHCGINIGGYVNVPQVVEYVKTLPEVVYVENNLYTCSQDTQRRIVEIIKEHALNRVVVASCTPRTHEPLFQDTIREAGLNRYLFEMANIRDQCSWIHMQEPKEATEKAKGLVRMAVAKARLLIPLKRVEIDVIQKALVIGGGIAGMVSCLSLAEQGFEVFLVETEKELGGNLRHIYYTIEGRDVQNFLEKTVEKLKNNSLIKVFTETNIESISGFVGNYETEIRLAGGKKEKIKHGVVIVATGAQDYQPTEYLYGKDPRIITQRELEESLSDHETMRLDDYQTIVMIQCVGSRDDRHPYCSRVCCSQATKNALRFLEINPEANIYVLYRDVRTYSFKEDFYRKAREAGVIFIRYDNDSKPKLEVENGKLEIAFFEPILNEEIKFSTDLIVLSTGIVPRRDNQELAKKLKVPLNSDGFFLEAHVKLRPVDFATEGIFVAGLAHSPKCIDESISQAEAAVGRAATILSHTKYYAEATVSYVDEERCAGCGVCSALCPYEAIQMITEDTKRKSKVNEALCKGCGTCVAACPSGAMEQYGFSRKQILTMVEALSR
ncbi:MAG: FAD-dependent oxidoreductase [candidate division WOR-3 bacterium]|nr:MAG: FAD-dependent oxidoreductase [candidate division WOR-3 bacterium]